MYRHVFYGSVSIAWLIALIAYMIASIAYLVAFAVKSNVASSWNVAVACLVM